MTAKTPRIVLSAMGHFHPANDLSNDFFNSLNIGSAAAWIEEVTGIRNRRSVLTTAQIQKLRAGQTTIDNFRKEQSFASIADMAQAALPMLLERRGQSRTVIGDNGLGDIDLAICGTSVPDFDIPAN